MYTIRDLRKYQYDYHKENFPFAFNFIKNPYSFLKARFYMESSAVFVWFLLKTNIKPNTVTIIYGIAGIITGILLSIPNYYTVIIALFIAFTKGILDWSDGHLARLKYEPSLTGQILDEYGASLNSIGLIIGLGFFAMHQSGYELLIYVIPILPFLHGEKFTSFGKNIILNNMDSLLIKDDDRVKFENHKIKNKKSSKYPSVLMRFSGFFDDRARSVDFILLIIVIDIYYDTNATLYILLLILLRLCIQFVFSFVYGVKFKWAEGIVASLNRRQ